MWKSLSQQGSWRAWYDNKLLVFSSLTMVMELGYVTMDWSRTMLLLNNDVNTMEWEQKKPYLVIINSVLYYLASIFFYVSMMLRVDVIFKVINNPLARIQIKLFTCVLVIDIVVISIFITCIYEDFTGSNLLFLGPPNIKILWYDG